MDKLNAISAFVRVAEQGGFSAAARQLGRSKAAVSKQVAELEAALGAQLLLRTTRRVSLTDAGRACLARCRQLLDDVEQLEADVRDREAALRGVLRVAGPVTFTELHLAAALDAFTRRHPALTLELTLTDGYVDLVEEHYDVAIRIGALEDSSLIARRLAASRVVCCAAPDYLAARGTPRTPRDLAGHDLVVDTNFRQAGNWRFVVGPRVEVVRAPARIAVNSAVVARDLAIAGGGIVRIPEFVVRDALADGRLERVPLEFDGGELGIHAVYPGRRHLAQRVRTFVDFLVAWFAGGLSRTPPAP